MNDLTKMGFVYDVTQLSQEGEVVNHQIIHNIIPNEGLKVLYECFFPRYVNPSFDQEGPTNVKNGRTFLFNFMENDYQPQVTDTWLKTVPTYYGCDGTLYDAQVGATTNVLLLSPYYDAASFSLATGSENLIVSKEISYTFNEYRTITGIFCGFCTSLRAGQSTLWSSLITAARFRLLSAALFYTPIQMVPQGVLKFKTAFTLIPS